MVFQTTVSEQNGKSLDQHAAFNNNNNNNSSIIRTTDLGAQTATADGQIDRVDGLENSAASNFGLGISATSNFLPVLSEVGRSNFPPKQISSSLSSGLSVGSVKVFLIVPFYVDLDDHVVSEFNPEQTRPPDTHGGLTRAKAPLAT